MKIEARKGISKRGRIVLAVAGVTLLGGALLWSATSEDAPDALRQLSRGKKSSPLEILPANAMTFHRLRAVGSPMKATFQGVSGAAVTVRTVWTVNGKVVADGPQLDPHHFERGDIVEARIEIDEPGTGMRLADRATCVIANAPPRLRSVTLQRPTDRPGQVIAAVDVADPDGDVVEVDVQWKIDGVIDATKSGTTIDVTSMARGQTVAAIAIASDGDLNSVPDETAALDVSNQPPTLNVDATPQVDRDSEGQMFATLGAHYADTDGDVLHVEFESTDEAFRWDKSRKAIVWPVQDGLTVADVVLRVRDDRGGSAERVITLKR